MMLINLDIEHFSCVSSALCSAGKGIKCARFESLSTTTKNINVLGIRFYIKVTCFSHFSAKLKQTIPDDIFIKSLLQMCLRDFQVRTLSARAIRIERLRNTYAK